MTALLIGTGAALGALALCLALVAREALRTRGKRLDTLSDRLGAMSVEVTGLSAEVSEVGPRLFEAEEEIERIRQRLGMTAPK